MKSTHENKTIFFNIRLEPSMHARLRELARANDRTVAGEIRVAVRRYLDENRTQSAA